MSGRPEEGLTDATLCLARRPVGLDPRYSAGREGHVGGTAADNRLFVEAVLFRFRAGIPWRDLPERFGDWKIVYQRFNRWAKSGVFERVFRLLASDHDNEYMMIPEAIAAVFPPTIVQTCIVHLIRNSMDFASWKDRKPIAAELKAIYRATDADVARRALEDFDAGVWGRKYPSIAQSWRRNWEHVIPFFAFPVAVRRIIYTTDEIDKRNLHWRVIYDARERPRDEARRVGCKRRQASYSFLAGLRRSRTSPLGARVFQRSTKRA